MTATNISHSVKPIPILYTSWGLSHGGAENQLLQLLLRLDKTRFTPYVCNLTETGNREIEEKIGQAGIPVVNMRKKGRFTIKPIVFLGRLMRKLSIQIVHSFGVSPNLWCTPVARALRVPVVLYSDHAGRLQRDWVLCLNGWVSKLDDLVIAHCKINEETLHTIDGISPAKTRIIYNGVDFARFSQNPSGKLKQELGLPEDTPIVCMVGRFQIGKAYDEFITAAHLLRGKNVPCHFVCVGDGSTRAAMEKMANDLGLQGVVTFLGSREDVPDLLADCAVLVLASHREGLPIAILEGMAAGLPIVCSQVGGCQEAVIDAESGFLVPPYDTQRLAEAIYALVSNRDLAHSFGETGRQRVSKYFDISENAAQIQRLYLDLLSRKNGNHN